MTVRLKSKRVKGNDYAIVVMKIEATLYFKFVFFQTYFSHHNIEMQLK